MPMVSIYLYEQYYEFMSKEVSHHWPGLSGTQAEYVDLVATHTDTELTRNGKYSSWAERFGTYVTAENALQLLVNQVVFEASYEDNDTDEHLVT